MINHQRQKKGTDFAKNIWRSNSHGMYPLAIKRGCLKFLFIYIMYILLYFLNYTIICYYKLYIYMCVHSILYIIYTFILLYILLIFI